MTKISDIFYKGLKAEEKTIIKQIPINWNQHANGILNIAKSLEFGFTIDKENEQILKSMLLYFSGNPLFEGSLNKGLLLLGGVGTGKSLLFKIFKKYTSEILRVNSYQMHNASEITDNVNVSGIDTLEMFNNNYGNPITCYIDDLAAGNENIKHYGTNHNVIEQLLNIRYNVYNRDKVLTHATTNKYPSELKEIYDVRIIDRLKEMFNFIELSGESRRK